MVKFVNKKKKEPERAAEAVVSKDVRGGQRQETQNDQKMYSKEGLFDIAYTNYQRTYPESNMKRRDFRRQIWGTDEMVSYLDKEQYGKYMEIMFREESAEGREMEHVGHGEVRVIGEVAVQENRDIETGVVDPLDGLRDFSSDIISEHDELLESPVAADLESAYDDSFLEAYTNAHFLNDPSADGEESEMDSPGADDGGAFDEVLSTAAIDGPLSTEDTGEGQVAEMDDPSEGFLDDMTESEPLDAEADGLENSDESTSFLDQGSENGTDNRNHQETMHDTGYCEDAKEGHLAVKAMRHDTGVLSKVEYPGIFGKPGIMEKLRRSIFLNESDDHMDDELLQFTDVEIFEQLIRLEGCVRKVPQISQIAQLVFGDRGAAIDTHLPSQERLVDIVNAAAGFIAFVSHTDDSDSDEMLNDMISQSLGLTEDELKMGFVEKQAVRKSYVVYYSDQDLYALLNVYGNYTDVCRAMFMFEQAYKLHGVRDLRAFLNTLGMQWTADEADQDMIDADIQIEEGRVILV